MSSRSSAGRSTFSRETLFREQALLRNGRSLNTMAQSSCTCIYVFIATAVVHVQLNISDSDLKILHNHVYIGMQHTIKQPCGPGQWAASAAQLVEHVYIAECCRFKVCSLLMIIIQRLPWRVELCAQCCIHFTHTENNVYSTLYGGRIQKETRQPTQDTTQSSHDL